MIQCLDNCLNIRQLMILPQKYEFINCLYLILINVLTGVNLQN